jgi:hypothetical protein
MRAYRHANPAFPHDTTFDQFFGEAQFESYRALGSFTVKNLPTSPIFLSAPE